MGEYLQQLDDVMHSLNRLPGLLTAIVVLQILTLLPLLALGWFAYRMSVAVQLMQSGSPAPTPPAQNPFAHNNPQTAPYGPQQPYGRQP